LGEKRSTLRVLFVQSQTEVGGAESVLLNVLPAVDPGRVEFLVAVLGFGRGDLPSRLRAAGVSVVELRAGRLRNPLGWLRTVLAVRRLVLRERVEVVVANGYHPHLYSHPAARTAGARSFVWCHDLPSPRGKGPVIERLSFRLRPDAYLVPSRVMSEAVLNRTSRRRPVVLVPNGVDTERFRPDPAARAAVREELGLAPEEIVVTVAGRLHPDKGQHLLLEAAVELSDCRFLIVGEALFDMTEGSRESLEDLARRLGVDSRCVFAGARRDMPRILAASDVVVCPSIKPESFGMVVAEAMSAGCAVVASRAGGPAELVEDGVSGLLCEPGSVAELAAHIGRLRADTELRLRLGGAARDRVLAGYSSRASARRLADCLAAALGPDGTGTAPSGPADGGERGP
jgi:glycosyltransferase involved in cell wall biosynthesis